MTGLSCDFDIPGCKEKVLALYLVIIQKINPVVFYASVFGDYYPVDIWTGKMLRTGAGRAEAAWEGGGALCGSSF